MASKYQPGNVTGIDPLTKRFVSMTPSQFAAELLKKSRQPPNRLSVVVENIARKVEAAAKANVRRTAPIHNAGAYRYIDYEITDHHSGTSAIVGYNRTYRPARLGNLLEFGGGGDHSPAHYDLALALKAYEQEFVDKTVDAGEGWLESRFEDGPRTPNPGYE